MNLAKVVVFSLGYIIFVEIVLAKGTIFKKVNLATVPLWICLRQTPTQIVAKNPPPPRRMQGKGFPVM